MHGTPSNTFVRDSGSCAIDIPLSRSDIVETETWMVIGIERIEHGLSGSMSCTAIGRLGHEGAPICIIEWRRRSAVGLDVLRQMRTTMSTNTIPCSRVPPDQGDAPLQATVSMYVGAGEDVTHDD